MRRSSAPISASRCSGVEHPKILGRDRFEFCRPRSQSSRRCMSVFWQLVREKSLVPKCFGIRRNPPDISKGIFQNDICRFESCMPSQSGLYAGTLRVSAWIEFHERKRWAHLSETGTRSRIDILQRSYPAFIILPCWEEVRPPDRHNSQVARPADPPAGRPDARDGVFAGRNTGLSP